MKIIYQIGRLTKKMEDLNFKINNFRLYKKPLSSLALKEHFGENVKVVLIYPVSLPFNKDLYSRDSRLDKKLKDEIKKLCEEDKSFKDISQFFKKHPHNKDTDDFVLIHSIGEYEGIRFNGKFNDIVLEILIDMIERYLKNSFRELYVDVSSGHNVYVSAFLEATKHFSVFSQLVSWYNRNNVPNIFIVYSDPIFGSSLNEFDISWDQLKFKAFFSSPIKFIDIDNYNLARKIAGSDRNLKGTIQGYFENFALVFSSLKNNIPLGLYCFGFDGYEDTKKFLLKILSRLKKEFSKNWRNSPDFNRDDYLKLILSVGFYLGIIEVIDKEGIKKYDPQIGIKLSEIKEKFGSRDNSLYKYFDLLLNVEWLGKEIRNFKEGKNKEGKSLKECASEVWQKISSFLYDGGYSSKEKRNFLAHCGFEKNITEIRKDKSGEIWIRWDEKEADWVKKILKKEV